MTELNSCTTNFFPELCGVNVIVDPQSDLGTDDDRILIIGQMGAGASATPDTVTRVTEATRGQLYGVNSMINQMIDEVSAIAPTAEIWVYAVAENGAAGSEGTATVTVTGVDTATASGVAYLWVNGRTYQAAFDPNLDTNDILAQRLAALILSADPNLTVTVTANVINIETALEGEIAGFLDVRTSYSRRPDQVTSPEITLAVVTAAATGLPNLAPLAALTDGFEFVINPYTDDVSVGHVSAYACSQWSGGSNSRAYGVFYGTEPQATTFGNNANNALLSYIAVNGALTAPYLESATYGALAFNQLNCQSANIAMSMTGQAFPAMLAPEQADVYSDAEKASLVENGMGYFNVNRVNDVIIGRAVTTFTVRDNGSLDTSLRDVNKPAIIACVSRNFRESISSRFAGYAFRNDGIVGNGSNRVTTLAAVRSYIISLAQDLSNRNLIENIENFVSSLIVRTGSDGCIEVISEPELVCPFCCMNVTVRTQ